MKKADNFDPGKWLVENKLTNQSKQLNEVSKSPNSTTKIVSYFSQYGGSGLFQTVRGINIMKNILKKELKFDPNNTEMDYTIGDEIADKIINNSFYREYIEEGEKAYNILKPIIEKYDSNIKFEDEGFMIDYDVYIGPEVITDDGDFDDLNEYLEQQLGSQYVKSTPEGLSDEIFLMLVQD
jgi:hypothetical protein